ncbi:hypothetical protein [Rhizobium leguminosarum]|uniref:hypothetical protein n=1 Tax=Rhizobium leguminosarum TaxID=384 RepID=UPI002E116896|nr:hypothetical protein U8Q02_40955 [Rhizobium leguminosarum]
MSGPRPHLRDLDLVLESAKVFFAENDVLRRLVTARDPKETLWTSEEYEDVLKIGVSDEQFIEAFAKAYVSEKWYLGMEQKLQSATGFGHAYGGDPELHLSSAFHEFMEFHPPRHEQAVRDWVRKTRTERPFATWSWVRVEIEDRWLEWDDVSQGTPVEGGLIEFVGLATAEPRHDELGLFKFVPRHLMDEKGKRWPPTQSYEIPRRRVLPVEFIAEVLPRSDQDHADMNAYLAVKKEAFEGDMRFRAECKARKKAAKIGYAADVEVYKTLIRESFGNCGPHTLLGVAKAAGQLAQEELTEKYLAKTPDFVDERGEFF